jgi:hypothetical protein
VSAAFLAVLAATAMVGPQATDGLPAPFRLLDPAIVESSSLVVARADLGLVYTANDGPARRVFAVDMASGRTVATTTLLGIQPVDVEAMAPGPGRTLYIADIGDNPRARDTLNVHRIPEPGRTSGATRPVTYRLAYPDGAHDAEALLVHPRSGRLLVVSKQLLGGTVYAAPSRLSEWSVNRLRPVAEVSGPVTDGAFMTDGRTAVLRTYGGAIAYRVPGWRPSATWRLPSQRQGESLAALPGRRAVLVGSEGPNSPVVAVLVPRPGDPPEPSPAAPPAPDGDAAGQDTSGVVAVLVVGVLALTAAGGLTLLRQRRH